MFDRMGWKCAHCRKIAKVLDNKVYELRKEVVELKKELIEVKKEQKEVKESVKTIETKCDSNAKNYDNLASTVKGTIFSEIRDRVERKCNVIIHGIIEARDTLPGSEKKESDIQCVIDITSEILPDKRFPFTRYDIKFIKRLGIKKNNECRPIQLGLHNEDVKGHILQNTWKLNNSDRYDNVYIY